MFGCVIRCLNSTLPMMNRANAMICGMHDVLYLDFIGMHLFWPKIWNHHRYSSNRRFLASTHVEAWGSTIVEQRLSIDCLVWNQWYGVWRVSFLVIIVYWNNILGELNCSIPPFMSYLIYDQRIACVFIKLKVRYVTKTNSVKTTTVLMYLWILTPRYGVPKCNYYTSKSKCGIIIEIVWYLRIIKERWNSYETAKLNAQKPALMAVRNVSVIMNTMIHPKHWFITRWQDCIL